MTLLFAADSISKTVLGLLARGKVILLAVVLVLVVASVAQTYIRTKSWVPAIGAALIGGFALWMVSNIGDVQSRAKQEVTDAGGDSGDLNTDLGNNNSINGG